ncbi:MAG: phosphoribosylanthranilate isomerase [Rhizobiales bacterium]|nr:phosphoribosylanthranilate isomerase [Hyphomicrobiales bacterium]
MAVEVKICGLSTPETMEAALAAKADMVGLVFYERSPRNVSVEKAVALANIARGRAHIIALVVDADDATLLNIARQVRPDAFQAHGSEPPERIAAMKALTGKPIVKAIRVGDAADIAMAAAFDGIAAFVLFDARAPEGHLPGGTGRAFDWTLLAGRTGRFMLAGGLTPGNVADAIRLTGAPMVDVSSGVESAPGVKDVRLIRKFIEAAKSAR